jgi:hypothetical protein
MSLARSLALVIVKLVWIGLTTRIPPQSMSAAMTHLGFVL